MSSRWDRVENGFGVDSGTFGFFDFDQIRRHGSIDIVYEALRNECGGVLPGGWRIAIRSWRWSVRRRHSHGRFWLGHRHPLHLHLRRGRRVNQLTPYSGENVPTLIEVMGTAIAKVAVAWLPERRSRKVLAMTCIAKGVDPLSLAQEFDIIQGKLSMRTDAMVARFHRLGGRHKIIQRDAERAEVLLPDQGNGHTFSLSWEEAQGEPWTKDRNGKLKTNYSTPRIRMQMLSAPGDVGRDPSCGTRGLCRIAMHPRNWWILPLARPAGKRTSMSSMHQSRPSAPTSLARTCRSRTSGRCCEKSPTPKAIPTSRSE